MLAKQLQGAALATQPVFVEEVFQSWLYTGTGATQTITNGIDLSGKGGLVWVKSRSNAYDHALYDTARGINKELYSNTTAAQYPGAGTLTAFNSNGFTLGVSSTGNFSGNTDVSWTFRKQAKFFDVVTYTGNGTAGRTVSHNLGSVPGCIIVKRTDSAGFDWAVFHRSISVSGLAARFCGALLNSTAAAGQYSTFWNETDPTSTVFSVGTSSSVNTNGASYVAYLFAHDAGGFGAAGTDNVISCGTFTTDGSENSTTNLGYEPQWLLLKATSGGTAGSQPWHIFDNMRGLTVSAQDDASLQPNNSNAESQVNRIGITSTGFTTNAFGTSTTFIYIAIRRGPMRTPTSGTSVFSPVAFSGTGTNSRQIDSGFPPDLLLDLQRNQVVSKYWYTRLFGNGSYLASNNTNAATGTATTYGAQFDKIQNGYQQGTSDSTSANATGTNYVNHLFRRAPGFFDVVCYTGTGSARTVTHNLGVAPELIIVKGRSALSVNSNWCVYCSHVIGAANTGYLYLNNTDSYTDNTTFWGTAPTSSVFSLSTNNTVNENTDTFVAYLFATVTGVSKVGSYTGNGTNQTIPCGFTAGARFIMIKRTNSTGDWVTFDTARGIVSGNDPALYLNSTAAEVTGIDAIDPDNSGFIVNQETTFNLNVNNASYIFLAVS